MLGMEPTEDDLALRHLGRYLVFGSVGFLSAVLLYLGYHHLIRENPQGYLECAGSAVFWYPLFRLGRYHARRSRRISREPRN